MVKIFEILDMENTSKEIVATFSGKTNLTELPDIHHNWILKYLTYTFINFVMLGNVHICLNQDNDRKYSI